MTVAGTPRASHFLTRRSVSASITRSVKGIGWKGRFRIRQTPRASERLMQTADDGPAKLPNGTDSLPGLVGEHERHPKPQVHVSPDPEQSLVFGLGEYHPSRVLLLGGFRAPERVGFEEKPRRRLRQTGGCRRAGRCGVRVASDWIPSAPRTLIAIRSRTGHQISRLRGLAAVVVVAWDGRLRESLFPPIFSLRAVRTLFSRPAVVCHRGRRSLGIT